MTCDLNPTQAFWLGHLYVASVWSMPLSDYADSQALPLTDLLMWEKRLSVQGLPVPPRAIFVGGEFLSVDDLAEDSQLRPHLDSPLEAPQEMFTYEGWMALHVAMAYIRDEEPPFEIL